MSAVTVPCGRRPAGEVRVPPSKSLTNRALNLALLAGRPLTVERPLLAEDTLAFLEAVRALGVAVERAGDDVRLSPGEIPARAAIDCGASGTMARFLTATLSVIRGAWRLDGSARLRARPLGPLIASLRGLGARVDCLEQQGFLPIAIRGGGLDGGAVAVDAGASSQYLSALAMAATRARGPLRIDVARLTSTPYVDLTLDAMRAFGARVEHSAGGSLTVHPGLTAPARYAVEGDLSAACYFAAAAALTGGQIVLAGVRADSRQGDRRFLDLLRRMGAAVDWPDPDRATVAGGDRLDGVDVDMSELPDQVPTLAAIAPFAAGTTRIRNVAHLRIKESDRLAACATELRRLGAVAAELPDGLSIPGVWAGGAPPATPVVVASHDDHRIAMSFALTGLRRPGVSIADPVVVAKSYPAFWEDLERCLQA